MEELMKLTQRHRERGLAIEENAAEREGRIVDWLNAHREAVKRDKQLAVAQELRAAGIRPGCMISGTTAPVIAFALDEFKEHRTHQGLREDLQ